MVKVLDVLADNFEKYQDKKVFVHFEGYDIVETITYGEFCKKVLEFAGYLQSLESKGERALLLLPISIDYLIAYCASLFSHTISIPLYDITEESQIENVKNIIDDSKAEYIITQGRYIQNLNTWLDDYAEELTICDMDNYLPEKFTYEEIQEEDIAYLQYTSGSTKKAKGVKISYRNLYSICITMRDAISFTNKDIFVGWLPFHFDMGLIAYIMNTLFNGSLYAFTSSVGFMKQPESWLNAVNIYRGTVIIAPNFAYEMCANVSEEILSKMDFSSIRYAVNGAELVRNSSIKSFTSKLKKYGFNPNVINPSYGLAENTLVATTHAVGQGYKYVTLNDQKLRKNIIEFVEEGLDIVSCGKEINYTTIKIVALEKRECLEEGQIGEIWIYSDSIAEGYWNAPDEEEVFHGHLEGDDREYLMTGDLGFKYEGHYYIVGRKKDMIIIRGKNIYSQDIEELIVNSNKEKINTAVAFSVSEDNEEKLVIIVEVRNKADLQDNTIKEKISSNIASNCKIVAHDIQLQESGTLPRTDSGKIKRLVCKNVYLENNVQ